MCKVVGNTVDKETRCQHWNGPTDIIALKLKCCPEVYYPCYLCHQELTTHPIQKYDLSIQPDINVILCGHCNVELTFNQYLNNNNNNNNNLHCPICNHQFNSGCKLHYHLYFDNIPITNS